MFRARVLARTLLYVFFVTSTFFRWLLSNYVEDYSIPKQLVYTYSTRTVALLALRVHYVYSTLCSGGG